MWLSMTKFLFILISFFSLQSFGMVLQSDVSPTTYREIGTWKLFDSVGQINIGMEVCTGFLIDQRTVLTAGHCIKKFNRRKTFFTLYQGEQRYQIPISGGRKLQNPEIKFRTVISRFEDKTNVVDNLNFSDLGVFYLEYPILFV